MVFDSYHIHHKKIKDVTSMNEIEKLTSVFRTWKVDFKSKLPLAFDKEIRNKKLEWMLNVGLHFQSRMSL